MSFLDLCSKQHMNWNLFAILGLLNMEKEIASTIRNTLDKTQQPPFFKKQTSSCSWELPQPLLSNTSLNFKFRERNYELKVVQLPRTQEYAFPWIPQKVLFKSSNRESERSSQTRLTTRQWPAKEALTPLWDTHPSLQAGKRGKMGVPCSPPLGSPRLETQAPDLLSCLRSLHSVPVRAWDGSEPQSSCTGL